MFEKVLFQVCDVIMTSHICRLFWVLNVTKVPEKVETLIAVIEVRAPIPKPLSARRPL